MKMPIPSDWDGLSTCDYRIVWPDSPIWRFILRGLMTNPGLIEFWDGSTGDVEQVLQDFRPIMEKGLDSLGCNDMNVPIGAILHFAGATLPANFLWADGSPVPIADYLELYQIIGDAFHPGGIGIPENFYLPNLNGRVAVGKDSSQSEFNTMGKTGGEKRNTLSVTEIPPHTHLQDPHHHTINGSINSVSGSARRSLLHPTGSDNVLSSPSTASNQYTGGGQSHNNLQPYICLNFIIRVH